MVVTAEAASGTLGDAPSDAGACAIAREMLASAAATRLFALVPSGPLFLFDALRPPPVEIVLFGAGHVGRSLARILAGLPCRLTWVDERAESFPAISESNVRIEVSDEPVAEVAAARAGSFFLVMTHSHPLDQELTEAILRRGDFSYFGLIGSLAKRRQFERRLAARGISDTVLRRMTCPIGIGGIEGKEPTAIAVAVAAQLLRAMSAQAAAAQPEPAHRVAWR
jgi:xanthine dehydrogenase accessory factor